MSDEDLNDELDDLLSEDDDATDETVDDKTAALAAQLADLEKANKGLLKEVKKERQSRQEFQGRFSELSETVTQALENRQGAPSDTASTPSKSSGSDKIMIEFDPDGNPYLPADALSGSNEEILETINELSNAFKGQQQAVSAESAANRVITSILSKDERYPNAYSRVEEARNYLDKQVVDYQKANGLQGGVSAAQAIQHKDLLFDTEDYSQKFGDVDMVLALRAMETEHDLNSALNDIAEKIAPSSTETPKVGLDNRAVSPEFKKVLNKPSGLGGVGNQKGAQLDVAEKLSSISSADLIDNLSDADVEKITQALYREETQQGVKY